MKAKGDGVVKANDCAQLTLVRNEWGKGMVPILRTEYK